MFLLMSTPVSDCLLASFRCSNTFVTPTTHFKMYTSILVNNDTMLDCASRLGKAARMTNSTIQSHNTNES
ncbi:hypothetical protein Y032_0152g2856 [Ancylostoma ceylanicum]|uniref:Uncharacterized protein n=1 Tax=Ancylostoma ceylanicum TaxID=53326 RepID=A0A016T0D2_9BILA|nr:hypothetical protein Y032_0152g2856 [Ancylostoma ceylanicum]